MRLLFTAALGVAIITAAAAPASAFYGWSNGWSNGWDPGTAINGDGPKTKARRDDVQSTDKPRVDTDYHSVRVIGIEVPVED